MVSLYKYDGKDNLALYLVLDSDRFACPSLYPGEGVWVGRKSLFANPETDRLQAFIRSSLPPGAWQLQGWGVVLEARARLGRHDHKFPGNVWSGVYYPYAGGGEIQFDDGSYQPEESSLIIFPADKPHSVAATALRYSIAFNVRRE